MLWKLLSPCFWGPWAQHRWISSFLSLVLLKSRCLVQVAQKLDACFSPGQHGLMSLTDSSVLHLRGWIVLTGHPSSGIGQKESRDRRAPCLYISAHSPGERWCTQVQQVGISWVILESCLSQAGSQDQRDARRRDCRIPMNCLNLCMSPEPHAQRHSLLPSKSARNELMSHLWTTRPCSE